MSNFRKKILKGLKWAVLERASLQLTQVALGIVLARLLIPEDFGLIAMLAIFIAIANSITDSGLSQALVQKKNPSELDKSTIFYFNISVGILITLIIIAIAPLVGNFYNEPRLTLLLRVLSLNILFTSFNNVQTWLLNKELNFKLQFFSKQTAVTISGLIAVLLALNGYGVWSLVAHSLIGNIVNTTLIWKLSPWRPQRAFSRESLKELFSFSFNILLSGQLNAICNELYYVVIGKLFSAHHLGFFAKARQTRDIPISVMDGIVQRITFPAFSMIQDDTPRQKRVLRKAIANIAFVNFPIMIGLALVAQPTVTILLTEKWLDSVPLLQLFCFAGLMLPIMSAHGSIIISQGKSKIILHFSLIKNILRIVILSFTWRWGIEGIIWGEIAHSFLCYLLFLYWSTKNIGYKLSEQFTDTMPYLVAASLMGALTFFAGTLLVDVSPIALLISQMAIGGFSYIIICSILKPIAFNDAVANLVRLNRSA
jgi:teichuronic acid exporter